MPDRSARISDPAVLKALAHPLRSRLLGLLRLEGPSTATRLAERVGESSGSTSYHLRQLEGHGMVGEARREGRERWWEARHLSTSWEPSELVDVPGGLEANEQMQRLQIELLGRRLREWAEHGRDLGREWAGVAGLSDDALRLTPEQTRQLTAEVYAVLDRWAADHPAATPVPGTGLVALHTAVFPMPPP